MNKFAISLLSTLVAGMLLEKAQAGNYYTKSLSPYSSSSSAACTSAYECNNIDVNAECRNGLCQCESGYVGISTGASSSVQSRTATAISLPSATVKCQLAFKLVSNSVQCNLQQRCCISDSERALLNDMRCFVTPDPNALKAYGSTTLTYFITTASAVAGVTIDANTGEIAVDPTVTLSNKMVTVGVKLNSNPPQVASAIVTINTVSDTCCAQVPTEKNFYTFVDPGIVRLLVPFDVVVDPKLKILFVGSNVDSALPGVNLNDLVHSPCNRDVKLLSAALATGADGANSDDFCNALSIKLGAVQGIFLLIDENKIPSPVPASFSSCTFQFQVASCAGQEATILHNFIYYGTDETDADAAVAVVTTKSAHRVGGNGFGKSLRTKKQSKFGRKG